MPMIRRIATRRMSSERFSVWFEKFKAPYQQTKFIHSYKSLENQYSELVIKHLLTRNQHAKVERFLHSLPKMSNRRFKHFLQRLRRDPTILYRYSTKDFTRSQHLIINYYLLKNYLQNNLPITY